MIAAVRGKVFDIVPGRVLIETGGGEILEILIPVSHYTTVKNEKEVLLYTVLRVKEDQILLYGFLSPREKLFFEKFISVSGVGGKTALSLISAFSLKELVESVNNGDVKRISSVPGIGKKTAQRVVLELTGKLELAEETPVESVQLRKDLISGLVNLGYPVKGVTDFVNGIMKENPDLESFEVLFKLALKKISKL